ncbi:uncharacterized protein LOC124278204 [Haliotis rubra]|uniref:uncharacterized protein LOC124278204 n=1 Tax=Haliotis rubra TaxID=36100 RepID=UPI001EE506B0|nr:uncharacterized protein LOC124278204 [Haliotis rubra]
MNRSYARPPKPITISGSKQFDEHGVIPITVKRTGDIQDLRNRYGYTLPNVNQVAGCKLGSRMRPLPVLPKADFWNNHGTTPPVVRLLFTGRLPLKFFTDICYGRSTSTPPYRYKPKPDQHMQREKELWEPKGDVKNACRRIYISIHEARLRHKQRMEQIQERAQQHHKKVEAVFLRQREMENKGLSSYFKKMERESDRLMEKWKKKKPVKDDSAIPLEHCPASSVVLAKTGNDD